MADRHSEVIIEFVHVGNAIKVSACDPATMREVSIIGSPAMPREVLQRQAVRKLAYVMERESELAS